MYDVSDFQRQVLDRSQQIPVLVDFWAEWCGPCRILSPVLERLAARANGAWELAKVNTEQMPDISASYGVQSIPNVKLFVDGEPVNEFVGALPESQIESWLRQAIPSRNRRIVEEAELLLSQGLVAEGVALLRDVVTREPENSRANALLARHLVFTNPAEALTYAERATDRESYEIAEAVRTVAHLQEIAADGTEDPSSEAASAYRDAARALLRREFDAALESFIRVIRLDRSLDNDGGRTACIAIFKLLGEDHPITQKYRRDFSNALY